MSPNLNGYDYEYTSKVIGMHAWSPIAQIFSFIMFGIILSICLVVCFIELSGTEDDYDDYYKEKKLNRNE